MHCLVLLLGAKCWIAAGSKQMLCELPVLRIFLISCTAGMLLTLTCGCGGGNPEFSSNRVFAARLSSEIGEPLSREGITEVQQLLEQAFGTPNLPLVPGSVPGTLVSIDAIRRAAGPVYSDEKDVHYGLYRKHCIRCHGVTGDGLGPAAKLLEPYPRDFRLGKFKYKSTPIGTKPTRHDLARILKSGIPGTSMPSFRTLKDEDVEALVDYVVYLSVRGETERALLSQLAFDFDNDPAAWFVDVDCAQQESPQKEEHALESEVRHGSGSVTRSLERLNELVVFNYLKWEVPSPEQPQRPSDMPVGELYTIQNARPVVKQDLTPRLASELSDSILRGAELFSGKLASCSQCHGVHGDGRIGTSVGSEIQDYDDWTKDWTIAAGIVPEDRVSLEPLIKAGALKPSPISARNLQYGIFRGGNLPEDLYRRIVDGIEGTPMPAAALQPDVTVGLTERQVWDLVNYCLNLKFRPRTGTAQVLDAEVFRSQQDQSPGDRASNEAKVTSKSEDASRSGRDS